MNDLGFLFLQSFLTNNVVLAMFLGLCSVIGLSGKRETAWSMSLAIVCVVFISSQLGYLLNLALVYFKLEHLRLLTYIAVIASSVQILEITLKKFSRTIFLAMGIFLPLITTNCIVLAVAVLQTFKGYGYVESLVFSTGTSFGYALVMMIMSGIRERFDLVHTPDLVKGTSYTFLIVGILAMIFSGFAGLGG